MKKIIALVVLLVFCGSVCYAAEAGTVSQATDSFTAACEVVVRTAAAPFEALFGRPREAEAPSKDVTPRKQK